MKSLVIGYGSIGKRHTRLLKELDCLPAVVSEREVDFPRAFSDLAVAVAEHRPDFVIIANRTHQHYDTLTGLAAAGFSGRVLVEKPLFERCRPIQAGDFLSVSVAYNLRFHPVIRRLREIAAEETILSVQAYVGQYLPNWRPRVDYRQSYSASAKQGGGALRDLSHELDYLAWLFGPWNRVTALGGHISPLEIDSDDIYVLLMQTERCPVVTVQMSYLDRVACRRLIINTTRRTIEADLVSATLAIDGRAETYPVEQDFTYREMHRALINDDATALCSIEEGLATLRLIEAAEQANLLKQWITK